MEIKEQKILRLTIDYNNESKQGMLGVMDYLEERFGNYKIVRAGPKMIKHYEFDSKISQLVAEVICGEED